MDGFRKALEKLAKSNDVQTAKDTKGHVEIWRVLFVSLKQNFNSHCQRVG